MLSGKERTALEPTYYTTAQFAHRACVTVRTLRFYDSRGLVSPSRRSDSGYRLYSDSDLCRLEQVLALKLLGLSLEQVKACLTGSPEKLLDVLGQQLALLREKRARLDAVIRAIEEAEGASRTPESGWECIARAVRIINMNEDTDWVKKHLTDDQRRKMEELSASSYSASARQRLQDRMAQGPAWTEQDQLRAQEQWAHVASEARRLASQGADPAEPEAQAIAELKASLLRAFTQGDPEIEAGLERFYEPATSLPEGEQPFDMSPYDPGKEGSDLLDRAMAIYRDRGAA